MTLTDCNVIGFLATTQPDKARAFYCDVLGLRLEEDNPAALILRTANAMLRIQKVRAFTPLPFTALSARPRKKLGLGESIRRRFAPFGGVELDIPKREARIGGTSDLSI